MNLQNQSPASMRFSFLAFAALCIIVVCADKRCPSLPIQWHSDAIHIRANPTNESEITYEWADFNIKYPSKQYAYFQKLHDVKDDVMHYLQDNSNNELWAMEYNKSRKIESCGKVTKHQEFFMQQNFCQQFPYLTTSTVDGVEVDQFGFPSMKVIVMMRTDNGLPHRYNAGGSLIIDIIKPSIKMDDSLFILPDECHVNPPTM